MSNKTREERRAELTKLATRDPKAFEELFRKVTKRPQARIQGSGLFEIRAILDIEFPESKRE